jgi:hypothetical protein
MPIAPRLRFPPTLAMPRLVPFAAKLQRFSQSRYAAYFMRPAILVFMFKGSFASFGNMTYGFKGSPASHDPRRRLRGDGGETTTPHG